MKRFFTTFLFFLTACVTNGQLPVFDMSEDFTIAARFRTSAGGAIVSKCAKEGNWTPDSKTLYVRDGRLVYDIGWLGAISSKKVVNDGAWHNAVLRCAEGNAELFVDGKLEGKKADFQRKDPAGNVLKFGRAADDFGGKYKGDIAYVRIWMRALPDDEVKNLGAGKVDETNTSDVNWASSFEESQPGVTKEVDHALIIRTWDQEAFDRGARVYNGFCITCHGSDKVEGTLPTALRFHKGEFKNGNHPHAMYQTLTKGFNLMTPQPWMTPQQKYDVIYYIRKTLIEPHNKAQLSKIDDAYLATLPKGEGRGPLKPQMFGEDDPKWKKMDYGPVQFWTMEVEPGNIAYKGIAVRLDEGPGGVAQGNKWMLYDHDTMRVAAAWEGKGYIDWKGIAFDQSHGSHASIVGKLAFVNPVGPGVASAEGSYEDPRFLGRDDKPYGPLPREWTHYKGLYMYGNLPILKYTVGESEVLEMPGYELIDGATVFTRTLTFLKKGKSFELRVAPEGKAVAATGGLCEVKSGFVTVSPVLYGNRSFKVYIFDGDQGKLNAYVEKCAAPVDLEALTGGSLKRWPDIVTTNGKMGDGDGAFIVDEITLPNENPWNSWMRLGGFDFFPDKKRAAVATWLGDVFIVDGIDGGFGEHKWQRIATGLFQPLGVKIVDGVIHVTCRDQIAKLHDLNGDEEIDFIESFNNDHQVTEHFHEFAMGLQTDEEGNFYYAKSARHAKTAIVPHHGTLLKVSADGKTTEIIATGFRAANGVCLNPDGTFIVTDQEGHWNPKNRINYVKKGGFYGNMFGYHDVTDESDSAMEQPLCWITNAFDRSPGELMWVPETAKWGSLNGSLLNLSYGMGKVFVVPHEKINGQAQGGMISLGLEFPTGIMRGRFHPDNGQLYAIGMFAWAGSKQQDGGFYRIRRTEKAAHLPVGLKAGKSGLAITFSEPLEQMSVEAVANWKVKTWALKRTKNYGSNHYDEKPSEIGSAALSEDGKTVTLRLPDIQPTWCMEIQYKLRGAGGEEVEGTVHNSVHQLGE
jgi:hypothetical protein